MPWYNQHVFILRSWNQRDCWHLIDFSPIDSSPNCFSSEVLPILDVLRFCKSSNKWVCRVCFREHRVLFARQVIRRHWWRHARPRVTWSSIVSESVSAGSGDQRVSSHRARHHLGPRVRTGSGILPQHRAHQREDGSLLVSVSRGAEEGLPEKCEVPQFWLSFTEEHEQHC